MVQTVKYSRVRRLGKVEIRHYPSLIIAKTMGSENERNELLASFINGKNATGKISQTGSLGSSKPLEIIYPTLSDQSSTSFIMPSTYTLETTPVPTDDRVKVIELPKRTIAALSFNEILSASVFEAKSKQLLQELEKAKLKTKGTVFGMLYGKHHKPKPTLFSRNDEVAIEIDQE
jgi:hypothetical protein